VNLLPFVQNKDKYLPPPWLSCVQFNQTLLHVQKWYRFENARPKFRRPPWKCGAQTLFWNGFGTT